MNSLFAQIKAFVFSKYFIKQAGLVVLFYLSVVFVMMVFLRFFIDISLGIVAAQSLTEVSRHVAVISYRI